MAVFRVHKSKDFTVMSNHHLRNKELSAKAKGILSTMLSLPEEWDYSAEGLAKLFSDGLSSIKSGLQELEKHRYLIRTQSTSSNGKFSGYDYDIFEFPYKENPSAEKPSVENPSTENQTQYNTDLFSTDGINNEIINEDNFSRTNSTSKNISSIPKKGKKGLDLSFIGIEYSDMMCRWFAFHKEIGKPYTQTGAESAYRRLLALSNGDARVADQIVEQSIANGWQGLFELKQNQQSYGSSNQKTRNRFCDLAGTITAAGGVL